MREEWQKRYKLYALFLLYYVLRGYYREYKRLGGRYVLAFGEDYGIVLQFNKVTKL